MRHHEWNEESIRAEEEAAIIRDSNGNPIEDGDSVTVIRDLKLGKNVIKQGSKA